MEVTKESIFDHLIGFSLVFAGILLTIGSPLGLVPLLAGALHISDFRENVTDLAGIEFSPPAMASIGAIGIVAAIVLLSTSGLFGASGGPAPGDDVSNVSVTAVDASHAAPDAALDVTWNSRAQLTVRTSPDDVVPAHPGDGNKFVVVRMTIENAGDEQHQLTPRLFELEAGGARYEHTNIAQGYSLNDVVLDPGDEYSGWTMFAVPLETTEARLTVDEDFYVERNVSVTFAHDPGLAINMSD